MRTHTHTKIYKHPDNKTKILNFNNLSKLQKNTNGIQHIKPIQGQKEKLREAEIVKKNQTEILKLNNKIYKVKKCKKKFQNHT